MSSPGRLRHRVGQAIAEQGLWEPGMAVVVAVSGGLDSVVLLDLLRQTRDWHGGILQVATVDHGTRPDSAADADWVAELARAWQLPCARFQLALGEGASEEVCRQGRRAALLSLDADRIALAHHRDDQAETVLLHLVRGAGTGGLASMAWCHGPWARPLLNTSRAELEAWAEHRDLSWREDPTNHQGRYLRNRIRRELMPLLEELRPGATAAMARSARLAADDAALLDALARQEDQPEQGPWEVEWLRSTPAPLVRRVLLRAAPELGSRHLDALLAAADRGHGAVELPGGRWLRIRRGRLRLE